MSGKVDANVDATKAREMWEKHLVSPIHAPKEADRVDARKHRLVALFGSADCYSANVHTDTDVLKELVDSLVKLDRLPDQTPPEGLQLLAQAWDENRGKYEEWSPQHGLPGHRGLLRPALKRLSCPNKTAAVFGSCKLRACPIMLRFFSL